MGYQLWDGFDDYDTAHESWDVLIGSATPTYSTTYARFAAAAHCAGLGIRFPGGTSCVKVKNMNSNQARMLFSFAFLVERLPLSNYNGILSFKDTGTPQCTIAIGADGSIALMASNSSSSVLAKSAPGVVTGGIYYFLDVDITIGVTGSVSVWLDTPLGGGALFTASGIGTRSTGNNWLNQFALGDINNGNIPGYRFDDFHAQDPTGSAPNTILGEGSRIYTKMPNAAGYATTLTPNGAAANWQCVDDNPPDDDTTYNSAGSFPLTEGYGVGAAGFTGTVNGIVRRSRTRKDDVSAHTFQTGIRSPGGPTNLLAAAINVTSAYSWTDACFPVDPSTGIAWLAAAADTAQPIVCAAS